MSAAKQTNCLEPLGSVSVPEIESKVEYGVFTDLGDGIVSWDLTHAEKSQAEKVLDFKNKLKDHYGHNHQSYMVEVEVSYTAKILSQNVEDAHGVAVDRAPLG